MRAAIVAIMLICVSASAEQYIYVRDGKVASAPRALPSVGVRQDTGTAVLGLHGASDATRAACGWFRVVPSPVVPDPAKGEWVADRSYRVDKNTVQEVVALKTRVVLSPEDRVLAVFLAPALVAMTEEARCAAVIHAVAQVITQRLDKAVTVTIPARREAVAR